MYKIVGGKNIKENKGEGEVIRKEVIISRNTKGN